MIVDVHTQIWSSLDQLGQEMADRLRSRQDRDWARLDASPAAHERAMHCVDASLVFGFRADRLGLLVPNEFVAEFVSKAPQHRLGVAGIDPLSADAMDQLETAVNLGFIGVTVCPPCQGFHPSHSSAMRVYERCAELKLPVFVSQQEPLTASAMLEFARPTHWDEVARTFPRLPIVFNRLGHPWINETLLLLGKHARVYADIAGVASRPWQLYNALVSAVSVGVMDKLLFASGFPFDTPAKAIENMYTVNAYSHGTQLPSVPRSLIRGIVERNVAADLGLDVDIARRPKDEDMVDLESTLLIDIEERRRTGLSSRDL